MELRQFKMESYLATSLHLSTLLSLAMMETTPKFPFPFSMPPPQFPFGMPPPPPELMKLFDSKYPFPPPPPFDVPPPPPSSTVQSASPPPSSTVQSASPPPSSTVQAVSPPPSDTVQSVSPPPPNPVDSYGFNTSKYAYDKTLRLAREIDRLVHTSEEEYLGTHMYFMLESPTGKALSEYIEKVRYAKENGGEECLANGEEAAIKNFRKRHAEVVWNCETGWKRNPDLVDKAKALLNAVDGLDRQADVTLKGCKPGQTCYDEFKKSKVAATIDKQVAEIRRNQLIDLRVLADQDHLLYIYSLFKCNADMSEPVRQDLYTSITTMNVCVSSVGLITTM